jgi:RNA polymerase sigma-70 factor (ECF subfamily)
LKDVRGVQAADTERWQRQFRPHLDAAWRLARWLTGNGAEAEEVVQDACLRAWRAQSRVAVEDSRAWLLAIVRNTAWTRLRDARRRTGNIVPLHEAGRDVERAAAPGPGPEAALAGAQRADLLHRALAGLPPAFREVVVLRDLEDCSYAEIAAVIGIPVGTVMSRLARGRRRLRAALEGRIEASDAG